MSKFIIHTKNLMAGLWKMTYDIIWHVVTNWTLLLSRYEKLQRWDDALKAYTVKASQASTPHLVLEATLGV